MFEYILPPKFLLKDYGSVPSYPDASSYTNLQHIIETHHWDFETCIFHPDVLIACRHHCWLLTLMIWKGPYCSVWRSSLDFIYRLSFWSFFFFSFYPVLSFDRKMKQKELYTYFILNYSLYKHQTWMFYLIPQVDTFWFPEI